MIQEGTGEQTIHYLIQTDHSQNIILYSYKYNYLMNIFNNIVLIYKIMHYILSIHVQRTSRETSKINILMIMYIVFFFLKKKEENQSQLNFDLSTTIEQVNCAKHEGI